MGRSQESFNKREVRNKKEKKRKEKEKKKLARKDGDKSSSLDDMIAWVDEFGNPTDTPPDPTAKKVEIDIEDIEISVPKRDPSQDEGPERKGVVTNFNHQRGFGFIRDSKTNESFYVHVTNTLEEIKENNLVTFELESGPKGPVACKVKVIR